jgi:hypothetical protein
LENCEGLNNSMNNRSESNHGVGGFEPFFTSSERCLLAQEAILRFNLPKMNSKNDARRWSDGEKMNQNCVFCFISKGYRFVSLWQDYSAINSQRISIERIADGVGSDQNLLPHIPVSNTR